MTFVKAQRQRVWLKVAVTGPSGSGKTFSALRLGFGLGKRIALIDTENGSGSLYAHLGDYDVMEIAAPFTAQKYISAIQEAVAAGYDTLIIDSLSHAWAGDGGLLDQKSAKDSRGGNGFSNWADISKIHEQLKSSILQSDIHLIATMRSKQDYVLEQGQNGKQTPRKVGLAPVQREGMEYEFTTVFDVDMSHTAATSKDRTGLFTDEISQITEDHGRRLQAWLAGGSSTPSPAPARFAPPQEAVPAAESPRPRTPQSTPQSAAPTPSANGAPACASCGKALTKAQEQLSVRNYLAALCPGCQKIKQATPVPVQTQPSPEDTSQPARGSEDALKAERFQKVGAVIDLMTNLSVAEKTAWLDRFETKWGIRNVRMLDLESLDTATAALKGGAWPFEGEYLAALEKRHSEEEPDPFAVSDQQALLGDPAEREVTGHGVS